jgi:hypothetical protein
MSCYFRLISLLFLSFRLLHDSSNMYFSNTWNIPLQLTQIIKYNQMLLSYAWSKMNYYIRFVHWIRFFSLSPFQFSLFQATDVSDYMFISLWVYKQFILSASMSLFGSYGRSVNGEKPWKKNDFTETQYLL